MPLVSIVMPTMRLGGLDVVIAGLMGQTNKDFELIISDALWNWRKKIVEEKTKDLPFRVRHVSPYGENPYPLTAFCRHANSGLVWVSGKIVLFITDYTWLPPRSVEIHSEFHRSAGEREGLMCPHQYSMVPPLSPTYLPYAKSEIAECKLAIEEGRHTEHMWSLFVEDFSGHPLDYGFDSMRDADPKLSHPPTATIDPSYFHGKNESCLLEDVLAVNGWDEELDGAHAYQDSDLSFRLVSRGFNWRFRNDSDCVAFIVNPRHITPDPIRLGPYERNHGIYCAKKTHGFPNLPNTWNLRDVRRKNLQLEEEAR